MSPIKIEESLLATQKKSDQYRTIDIDNNDKPINKF